MLSDGAFVAAESGVDLRARTQGLGNALFAQSGGFFVGEATGKGKLAVSGFGSGFIIEVEPGKDMRSSTVRMWWHGISQLHYEISVLIDRVADYSVGWSIASPVVKVLCSVSGRGKVVICSRNRNAFASWIRGGASAST